MVRSAAMTEAQPPLGLIKQLADALDQRGVSYCHWKSTTAIARSEAGENDLDLLVDRRDAIAFREVLSQAGFTRAERQAKPLPPGKEDYFGYDTGSGKMVHVDVDYQLVIGHDRSKNYRIPLEEAFLAEAQRHRLFYLPPPELEYVVLLIRMVLKYAIWDEVLWQTLRGRRAGPSPAEAEELSDLESRSDPRRLDAMVDKYAPWFGQGLRADCAAVARGEVSLLSRLRIGRQLTRQLAAHARHPELVDGPLRLIRRLILAFQQRVGSMPRFKLANGGAIIALIGGDGSGKSTAITELDAWLGSEFETKQIHLGKPPWSVTTYGVRGTLKLIKLAGNALRRKSTAGAGGGYDPRYREVAWLACTGRDRYLLYRRARRFANRGGLVLSDRYPHPLLKSMDVALIARVEESPNRLTRLLQCLEDRYHKRIEMPEVLAVLLVDPETAAQRKADEPTEYVRQRVAEVWEIDWEALSVPVVDASRSKAEVVAQLKSLIWDALS